ncbi:MAG: carbohydrate kinase [Sediminibacterium sp.]|jgi:xylulokinase|nr:MAG: carbohydrate kinase [Sediminibacterium sp.]
MYLLGIDIGTSFIKVSLVEASTQKCILTVSYPDTENAIISHQNGWAEQSPLMWWEQVQAGILKLHKAAKLALPSYNSNDIAAIGIAYQMHGLVIVDKNKKVLRDSIIWCDSRAVPYGEKAFDAIGHKKCLSHLLNSLGNFTAAKLAWVKENELALFAQIYKIMLPGDFIAMRLTGKITTSISALSEGIFWDFKNNCISKEVLNYFGFEQRIFPEVQDVFSNHGALSASIAPALFLKPGIPISYKAGDQPNNALSLNVLEPGEVAATAGTSGVIYGVGNTLSYDMQSRVNSFAHVNHTSTENRIGMLLCINGTGILNSWVKKYIGASTNYTTMNEMAATIAAGSDGLSILPFGNGAERIFNNKIIGAQMLGIDLNKHSAAHIYKAAQEGIAFAFRYGLDIMRENKLTPSVIKAGQANLFLSPVFTHAFVNATGVPVDLYNVEGSVGAALGAGIGAGIYKELKEAFADTKPIERIEPTETKLYDALYENWKDKLAKFI